jgi:hypothetical protein
VEADSAFGKITVIHHNVAHWHGGSGFAPIKLGLVPHVSRHYLLYFIFLIRKGALEGDEVCSLQNV